LAIPIVEETEEHSDESSILHSNDLPNALEILSDGKDIVMSRTNHINQVTPPPLPPRSLPGSQNNIPSETANPEKKSSLESIHSHELTALKQKISNEITNRDAQLQKFGEVMNKLEKFETLAKLQMKQISQSAQSLSNLPRTNSYVPPLSADPSSPTSMFKEFESYKQETQSKIDQLEYLLKEERTKTSRFMVLKMENQELHEIIENKDKQIKNLNEGIVSLNDQLSDLKKFVSGYETTVQSQKLEIDSLKSQSVVPKNVTLEVGEPGYVMQVRKRVFDSKDELSQAKAFMGTKQPSFSEALEESKTKVELDRILNEQSELKEKLELSSGQAMKLRQENEELKRQISQSKIRDNEAQNEKIDLEKTIQELNSNLDQMKMNSSPEESPVTLRMKAEFEKLNEIIRNGFKFVSSSKGLEPEPFSKWKGEFQSFIESLPKDSPSIYLLGEVLQYHLEAVENLLLNKKDDGVAVKLEKRLQESEVLLLKQWEDFNSEKNQLSIQFEQKDREIFALREYKQKYEEQQLVYNQIEDKLKGTETECKELNERLKSATLDIMYDLLTSVTLKVKTLLFEVNSRRKKNTMFH
jgi:DNA repair exonuclease SbcCD ATPase subunit